MISKIYAEFNRISNDYLHRNIECEGFAGLDDFYFTVNKLELNKNENILRLEFCINGRNNDIIESIIGISDIEKSVGIQCFSRFIKHTWSMNFSKIICHKLNEIAKDCEIDNTKYEQIDSTQFLHKYSVCCYKYGINDINDLSFEVLNNMILGASLMCFYDKFKLDYNV